MRLALIMLNAALLAVHRQEVRDRDAMTPFLAAVAISVPPVFCCAMCTPGRPAPRSSAAGGCLAPRCGNGLHRPPASTLHPPRFIGAGASCAVQKPASRSGKKISIVPNEWLRL